MKIYDKNNLEIYDISVDDSSVRYRAIMTDDSLTLNFAHTAAVTIPRLSYVNFEGQRYTLWRPSEFKKLSTRNFEYTLVLHGWREYLKFVKYKDMSAKPYLLKFSLTGKPIVFLQNLVATLNHHDAAGGWVAGDCIDAPEKTLSFNHEFCIDALGRFAQEWQTEFEFEGKKIHLRKVEKFKSDPLPLSYGKGNGFLPGVGRYNEGDKQPIGRLFVQGGERNIDFSTYNSKSLLLPKSATLVVDGKTYRTDADGMFITKDGNTNTAEDSYDASEIYPKRVGTVSEVVVVDSEKHFYDIKDSSIPEALNYRDCRIAGEKAIIKFESGALAGREFDIEQTDTDLTGYIHAERRFKIVPVELDGQTMPGGVFIPAVGDKYAIFNISMPTAYISDNATKTGASWDMFREAVRFFAENENDRFRFSGELDSVWSKSRWLEIGGKIVPGGHVLFSDDQFQPTGVVIRIVAVKDYVNKPHKPEITLSNAPISGSFSSGLAKLEADEVVIDEKQKEVIRLAKRQWRDIRETMEMLNASLLNFSGSINPITVQTMQLILGDESLQFRFVNSKTVPIRVNHSITFNTANKTLSAAAGILQHMTIGITTLKNKHAASEYKYWDMAAYTSPVLDASKAYYLYAKCSKITNSGTFLLSETAIAMEGVTGFYHLLVGILNSENLGERSFASLYGYTEITPGRVVTNRIESEDGETFFDLVNGIIGGKIRFIATGGTETNLADWADGTAQDIQDAQSAANSAALAAQQAIDDAAANVGLINTEVGKLQAQIDGEVSNWFYPYSPTLANYPASDWTTNAIKDRHIGDTFTNTAQAPATDAGKSWRFVKNGTVYSWTQIADSDAVLALQKAAQAQSTADGKSTTYLIQPTKYSLGDMWVLNADTTVNGIAYKSGEILTATQDSTTYNQAHWVKKVRYTDDSAVNNLKIGGRNLFILKDYTPVLSGGAYLYYITVEQGKEYTASTNIPKTLTFDSWFDSEGVEPSSSVNGFTIDTPRTIIAIADRIYVAVRNTTIVDKIKDGAYWVKVEKGNKVTDYSEAPEDTQAKIDAAVVKATYWSVKASAPVIYKDAINAATSGTHTPVTVSGELRSGTTATAGGFITVTPNGGTEAGTASASPVTIAPTNGDGKTSYTVRLYDTAAKTTLLDTMTIPVVFKGASGVNAINVVLSNEADVLPASTDGTVSDYSGSGTIIRVFEGATELDYDGIGTASGKFNVAVASAAITAGTRSKSGLTCVFANASNMTADNASIVFTITGKTTDGTSFSLTKTQSFAKSRTGQKGDAGVSITDVDIEFAKNTDVVNAPTTGWTTAAQTLTGTEQLWTRTKTTYSAGTPTYSTPANITPKTGATGQGIDSVTEQYILSSSKTTQPAEGDAGWNTTPPTWENGKYIWSRVKVVYKNPASTIYTGYAVSSEWEAVNELVIGVRNLFILEDYNPVLSGGAYYHYINAEIGKQYTVSTNIPKQDINTFDSWFDNEGVAASSSVNGFAINNPHTITATANRIYIAVRGTTQINGIKNGTYWVKVEKGSKATDWIPAIEDTSTAIERAQLKADGYMAFRYVRDWAKGSTSNNNNIWGEIKVINKAGTNIALSKTPSANGTFETANPASNITDNITTTYATIPNVSNVANYVQIDLGAINYDIDYIQVWHYPERTFYGTKTEISVDGVNWTPVFDSAKSGTYKETAAGNIISLRPHEVLAKTLKSQAITDKFGTTIDGGLIGAVTMLLRELNSTDETAGISGIRGANRNLPAFWTGTYADAIAGTAGIIFRHNSTGKIGVLDVDANGNVKLLDAADPNLIRLIFSKSQIPLVADILSSTQFGQSVTNLSSTGSTTGSTTLANGLSVTKDGSELTFSGILSVYAILDFAHGYTSGYAEISISLFKNGSYYAALSSVGGSLDASMDIINETYNLNSKLIVPSGNYTIVVQRTFYGVRNQTGGISNTSTFAWSFVKDIRRFEFGLDGFMSWYTNCHSHFTENGGYDGRAPYNKWNMPGVLAAGSSTSGGIQSNVWGAKSSTANITPITGGFRVPLSGLSHSNYVVQITPHTNTTFRVGTKTSTYFEVYGTGGFDYVVIGNNYA